MSPGTLKEQHTESRSRGGAQWFVARTQAHKEDFAARHLRNQGFEVFLPRIVRTIRHARQFRSMRKPLFPQYIFVKFDPGVDPWRSINGTRGIAYLISSSERPVPLPPNLVETLIAMTDRQGEFQFEECLSAGARVEVKSGPFASFVGRIERLDPDGRALLLLKMMGQEVHVWSDARSLSIAS